MPGFVAAAVATAVFSGSTFSVAAGLTLGFSWTAFAGAIVLGGASSLLAPKPKGGGALPSFDRIAQDRTVTVQEAVGKGKIHFGRLRLGGVRTLVEKTGGDNGTLHILITLSCNPLKGMDELWFADEVVPLDANGEATGNYAGYAKAWFGDGTPSGDATLNAKLKEALPALWTDAHKQTGCAKLYVQLTWNSDKFANGVPNMTAVCRCETAILDPRDASTGWTDNAALVLARYLTIPQNAGGFGAAWSEIDEADLVAAANICDEIVPLRAKQTTFTANAGTDLLTLADGDMNLVTGSRVRVSSTGTLPGGLSAATDYFFIVVGNLTGKLASSEANAKAGTAIDLSSAGSGTHTIRVATNFTADAATDRLALADTSGRLRTGTVVRLFTDGTLPGGLATGTDYYFCETGSKAGGLATSLANARSRTLINITSAGTGTHQIAATAEPRYTANGTAATESAPDKIIGDMLTAMGGRLIRSEGKWIVRAGAWRASSRTLAADDLVEGFKVAWRREPRDVFNGVKGTFVDPDGGWQATDYPSVAPAAFLTEDQGVRAWSSGYNLEFTTSPSMAQRLARIELERVRRQITTSLVGKLSCLAVKGGDTIAFDWPRYGWTVKTFEVVRFKFGQRSDGDAPSIVCEMELAEIDANVYAWNAATDEASMSPAPRTNLPSASTVAPPTSLVLSSGTAELDTRNDGTIFSRLKAAWTAPADAYVVSGGLIEIQYKKSADGTWGPSEFTQGSATSYRILDVADGEAYDVRVRGRNYIGAVSAWVTATDHVVEGKTVVPSDVTGFAATLSANGPRVSWNAIADLDLREYELRYAAVGTGWADATKIFAGLSLSYLWLGAPIGTWELYLRARDTSGNLSATVATASLTISLPTAVAALVWRLDGTAVAFDWNIPASDLPIVRYQIWRNDAGETDFADATLVASTSGTNLRIDPVDFVGTRRYWVRAIDVGGYASDPTYADATVAAPSAPLDFSDRIDVGALVFEWRAPATSDLGVVSYEVFRTPTAGGAFEDATLVFETTERFYRETVNFVGNRRYWVRAVDRLGNPGAVAARIAGVLAPADVTVAARIDGATAVLSWSPPAAHPSRLAVASYVLSYGATLVGATFLRDDSGTVQVFNADWTGLRRFWVQTKDLAGNLSAGTSVDVTLDGAAAPTVTLAFSAEDYVLSWAAPASALPIASYKVLFGADLGTATLVAWGLTATQFRAAATWVGARTFWVRAVDASGRDGAATSIVATVNAPAAPAPNAQAIDNFVTIAVSAPVATLPVVGYRLWRGAVFGSAAYIKQFQGSFDAIFEGTPGTYVYWVAAVDSAGNQGTAASVSASVVTSPDFVLLTQWQSTLGGTRTNAALSDGKLVAPVDTAETYEAHFVARGWASPQDQIDAGYPLFLQPTPATASYVEIFDYGVIVQNTLATVTLVNEPAAGSVAVSPLIEISTDGTTYTIAANGWQATLASFRYLRVTLAFAGLDATSLAAFGLAVKIDIALKDDGGLGTAAAADVGGTQVNFTKSFLDIQTISVTPTGTAARIAVFDFVDAPNPTGFKVLLFDTAGARVSGGFSWTAKGY